MNSPTRGALLALALLTTAGCGSDPSPSAREVTTPGASPAPSSPSTPPEPEAAIVTYRCQSGGEPALRFLSPTDGSEIRTVSIPDPTPSDAPRSLAIAKGCGGEGDGRLIREALNDDFTLMAYSAQVEGESGAMRSDSSGLPLYHSGYVDLATGEVTDLTATREEDDFASDPVSERFAYFAPGNRLLFLSGATWETQKVGESESELSDEAEDLDSGADADSTAPAVLMGRGGAMFGLGIAPLSTTTTATAAVSPTTKRLIRNCYDDSGFGRANVNDQCLELVTSQDQAESTDRAGKRWTADAATCRPLDWYLDDQLLCITTQGTRTALATSEVPNGGVERPWFGIGLITPLTSREITAASVSPDAEKVAFVASEGANHSLYVSGIKSEGEPTELAPLEDRELLIGWTGDREATP